MDQGQETVVFGFADHFAAGHQFGIETVQDVLEVLPFFRLFTVEEFKEFLDELVGDEHFKRLDIGSIIDNQLQEEFIYRL